MVLWWFKKLCTNDRNKPQKNNLPLRLASLHEKRLREFDLIVFKVLIEQLTVLYYIIIRSERKCSVQMENLTFHLENQKEFRFWALSIGKVLKSGILFLFQVGKLDFYACNVIFYIFEKSTENEASKTFCPETTVTTDSKNFIWTGAVNNNAFFKKMLLKQQVGFKWIWHSRHHQ